MYRNLLILSVVASCIATASADEASLGRGYIVSGAERTVQAEQPCVVAKVLVKEGQFVKRGEVLTESRSHDLELSVQRAAAERAEAVTELRLAEAIIELAKIRIERLDSKERQEEDDAAHQDERKELAIETQIAVLRREQAKAKVDATARDLALLRDRFERLCSRSPLDGLVSRVHVSAGDVVEHAGQPLISVIQPEEFVARIRFPAAVIGRLRAGESKVSLRSEAFGEEVTGMIVNVAPIVDRPSQTILTEVDFDRKHWPAAVPGIKVTATLK